MRNLLFYTLSLSALATLAGLQPAAAQNTFPASGEVGIGTTSPQGALHITEAGAPPNGLVGLQNGLLLGSSGTFDYKWIQSYADILALNPKGNSVAIGRADAANLLDVDGSARVRTTGVANVLLHGGSDDAFLDLTKQGGTIPAARIEFEGFTSPTRHEGEVAFFTRGQSDTSIRERMRIQSDGDVVIPGPLSAGNGALSVASNSVQLRNATFHQLNFWARGHACIDDLGNNVYRLTRCLSDAEYAPAADLGDGLPTTGDLVSLVPGEAGSTSESTFLMVRSSKPCDSTVVGFISDPQTGASGKKVDDSYLPLAQTGFFPVNVTMENGPIRRGDPIASSSTPGAGMRSLGACRIVGYALEDTETDGTINVIARLGDDAGAVVEDLALRIEKLEARLAAAESSPK